VLGWLFLWQTWWRDVLLMASGCSGSITYLDRRAELAEVAASIQLEYIHDFLQRIGQAREQLDDNVNPQLALENLVLHVP
jgi:DNA polymerase-3 subunit delta'